MASKKERCGIEKGWPLGDKKEERWQKREETREKTEMTEESREIIEEKSQKLAASQAQRSGPGMAVWHRKEMSEERRRKDEVLNDSYLLN